MESEMGFYMVFMEGGNTPAYKHTEKESAIKEAKRLAEKHRKKTYLLTTLQSYEYNCFDVRPAYTDDNMPF